MGIQKAIKKDRHARRAQNCTHSVRTRTASLKALGSEGKCKKTSSCLTPGALVCDAYTRTALLEGEVQASPAH